MFQPEFSLPVALPLRFFRIAPIWLALVAILAFSLDESDWQQRFSPSMLAITHLLMLGFVGNIMIGALLQVSAVLAGVRAKNPLFWGSQLWLALQSGTVLLAVGLWQMQLIWLQGAAFILFASLGGLVFWLLIALWRSGVATPLRWAIVGLGLTVLSGTLLVSLLSTGWPTIALHDLLRAHIALGSMGWIVGLIVAVAFTVVPMFLVAPAWPSRLNRYLSLALLATVLAVVLDARLLILLTLPVLSWFLTLLKLLKQSQRRADPARYLWGWGGFNLLLVAVLTPWIDELSALFDTPSQAPVILAGYFLFAGVIPIITAMLAKIIPFLLWMEFRLQVKSGGNLRHMGQLFPERWLRKLAYLSFTMSMSFLPLYLFASKAIPIFLLIYAASLSYCLEKALRVQKKAYFS
ncbi:MULTISPECIES: hypothetical protein [Deefgea]|uniref:Permease n=1 Tax=Deefgea chitinilytica TaxID=570276 RepID=A0ABS2CDN2_9NEIS|nr:MULTISPECIES: hypothetical protein [Deefgea]MBM5572246.1 hypothetical protein [Deefgea chitinilytica]MBM9889481.1 hypothetical protein [Deefgea sp. CFH1-16]